MPGGSQRRIDGNIVRECNAACLEAFLDLVLESLRGLKLLLLVEVEIQHAGGVCSKRELRLVECNGHISVVRRVGNGDSDIAAADSLGSAGALRVGSRNSYLDGLASCGLTVEIAGNAQHLVTGSVNEVAFLVDFEDTRSCIEDISSAVHYLEEALAVDSHIVDAVGEGKSGLRHVRRGGVHLNAVAYLSRINAAQGGGSAGRRLLGLIVYVGKGNNVRLVASGVYVGDVVADYVHLLLVGFIPDTPV